MTGTTFALLSILPLCLGTLPDRALDIEARLCGGGSVSIPIPQREAPPAPSCDIKGCHAACNRKRIDPSQ